MVVVVILLCFAGLMFLLARRYEHWVQGWQEAEALRLKVDLLKREDYSARLIHDCDIALGVHWCVETEKGYCTRDEAQSLIKGIGGTLSLSDTDGEIDLSHEFSDDNVDFWQADAKSVAPILLTQQLPKGKYTVELSIHEPAAALAGMEHTLVARYWICARVFLPAAVSILGGFVAMFVAAVIIIVMGVRCLKDRRERRGSVSSETTSA